MHLYLIRLIINSLWDAICNVLTNDFYMINQIPPKYLWVFSKGCQILKGASIGSISNDHRFRSTFIVLIGIIVSMVNVDNILSLLL